MASLELVDAGLTFHVRKYRRLSFKEFIVRQMFRQSNNPYIELTSLADIQLSLRDGDRLGIIGHNGAGKSVLLRVLAGIYPLTRGTRTARGKISALFDISLGFVDEASGWENIRYRSYLQGETPASVKSKLDEIAAFSELGHFLDLPIRCYSPGMRIRLAFAIATAIEPEILLVDEVLSVGDLAFVQKAQRRMQEMLDQAKLIVMVSHDLSAIEQICDRTLWLHQGRIHRLGPTAEVIAAYRAAAGGRAEAA